jgi:hypothetical protein
MNPVHITASDSVRGIYYFLSVFHTVSDEAAQNYNHYAFAFYHSRPFRIVALSSLLPLNMTLWSHPPTTCGNAPFAFVSGLTLTGCSADATVKCLLISYGVCDAESRAAEMRLKDFESTLTVQHTC